MRVARRMKSPAMRGVGAMSVPTVLNLSFSLLERLRKANVLYYVWHSQVRLKA